ncbi:helicase [Streptomyces sp. S1D4-11]|nr:helicase [Streptomyces sp. S1D4-11]
MKLGVFLSNTKSKRGKLTAVKLQQLANLGPHWTE